MKKLVIFDLDGTLLDSLADLAASTNHALAKHGYPTHELASYKHFVGSGVHKLLERALPERERTSENVARLKTDFMTYYALHQADYTTPYPGILSLLQHLKQQGTRLAVASNKYHSATEALVSHYFGKDCFDHVYGQRKGIPVKPDPTIVFDILQDARVDRTETLYVGDSGVDMQTAFRAGVESVGVLWGFRERAELLAQGACHVAETPVDILRWINS